MEKAAEFYLQRWAILGRTSSCHFSQFAKKDAFAEVHIVLNTGRRQVGSYFPAEFFLCVNIQASFLLCIFPIGPILLLWLIGSLRDTIPPIFEAAGRSGKWQFPWRLLKPLKGWSTRKVTDLKIRKWALLFDTLGILSSSLKAGVWLDCRSAYLPSSAAALCSLHNALWTLALRFTLTLICPCLLSQNS